MLCKCVLHFGTFLCRHLLNREFKKRQRLRQRQPQKAVILLVERTKMIVLHVRHAFLNISLPFSSKLLREITKFEVLTTTWTNCSESFSLTLYFKSVRTNLQSGSKHFGTLVKFWAKSREFTVHASIVIWATFVLLSLPFLRPPSPQTMLKHASDRWTDLDFGDREKSTL